MAHTAIGMLRNASYRATTFKQSLVDTPERPRLIKDDNQQLTCRQCKEIDIMIIRWRRHMDEGRPFQEFRYIHNSFQYLKTRAAKGCQVCRILRCALYSAQITRSQADRLSEWDGPVRVEVVNAAERSRPTSYPDLLITLDDPKTNRMDGLVALSIAGESVQRKCRVACMPKYDAARLGLEMSIDYESVDIFELIRKWMDQCSPRCYEVAWSKKLPNYLIQIRSEETGIFHLRLVESKDDVFKQYKRNIVRYACLSYSWGRKEDMTNEDWASIENGMTTPANLRHRKQGFLSSQLPNTMRQAICLMKRVGIEYIWIDSVCIVSDDGNNWDHDALRMHEVYGNACLTLCVCATTMATEPLFFNREAWRHKSVPCTLGDTWLTNYDVPLNEVRQVAPIFKRGWILQEERLSARILYWSGQRLYWSCCCAQRTEMPHYTNVKKKSKTISLLPLKACHKYDWLQNPQSFLQLRGGGRTEEIHPLWLDMVQDFTQRNMFTSDDRTAAMSGLAAQYLASFPPTKEEYIVGLWRATFAKDLAWRVTTAQNSKTSNRGVAPSFSWMSLPFECETRFKGTSDPPCRSFELLGERPGSNGGSNGEDTRILKRVERGNQVKQVIVKCRIRRFLPDSSVEALGSITPRNKDFSIAHDDSEQYDFSSCLDHCIHAREPRSGKIVLREIHKDPIFGQLDYQSSDLWAVFHESDFEHSLYAIEIGIRVMILAVRVPGNGSLHRYERVGIAWSRRENFFDLVAEVEEAILV